MKLVRKIVSRIEMLIAYLVIPLILIGITGSLIYVGCNYVIEMQITLSKAMIAGMIIYASLNLVALILVPPKT